MTFIYVPGEKITVREGNDEHGERSAVERRLPSSELVATVLTLVRPIAGVCGEGQQVGWGGGRGEEGSKSGWWSRTAPWRCIGGKEGRWERLDEWSETYASAYAWPHAGAE